MSVTWNGSNITGPVLVYLDEILVNNYETATIGDLDRLGALVCRSEDRARVGWYFTDDVIVSIAPRRDARAFIQTRTGEGVTPSVSRLSLSRENVTTNVTRLNGLWHCRLDAMGVQVEQINVGIYSRGEGTYFFARCVCAWQL